MSSNGMKRRLERMERKNPKADALLTFPDGSTRAVVVGDPLGVLIRAMERVGHSCGPAEGHEDNEELLKYLNSPLPRNKFDDAVELIGRATSIEASGDVFLSMLWEEAVQAVEMERNKIADSALTGAPSSDVRTPEKPHE